MNDEEAQLLLRGLRGALGDLGSRQIDLPAEEQNQGRDVRQQLAFVLDEYESLLVHGPDLIDRTMGLLNADSLSFRGERPEGRPGLSDDAIESDEVRFTAETVRTWRETTSRAREAVAELRRRLNGQPG